MRQNFEGSMLETFDITRAQLGECHSIMGVIFFLTYVPSGWLSDKLPTRWLMSISMAGTGLLALWLSTAPSFAQIKLIFIGWGLTSGLTLWGALIKGTSLLAPHDQQGRFFGLLESGRGLVEALLATVGLAVFAYFLNTLEASTSGSLTAVIWFYGLVAIGFTPILFFALRTSHMEAPPNPNSRGIAGLLQDLKALLTNQKIWLAAMVILIGYQIFWVTYSLAGLLQSIFQLSAVTVGAITVGRLWMRPLGGVLAGFIGDYFRVIPFLGVLMLIAGGLLALLPSLPATIGATILFPMVLLIGLFTYGVRGIFWATLDECDVSASTRGLAVGIISLLAYTPDIYVPMVQSWALANWGGQQGFQVYYGLFGASSLLGFFAARRLIRLGKA
jgi:sugar phosphate permease